MPFKAKVIIMKLTKNLNFNMHINTKTLMEIVDLKDIKYESIFFKIDSYYHDHQTTFIKWLFLELYSFVESNTSTDYNTFMNNLNIYLQNRWKVNTKKPFILSNTPNFYECQISIRFLRKFFKFIFYNKTMQDNFLDIFSKMFNYQNFIIELENRVKNIKIEIKDLLKILGIKINY